MDDKYTAQQLTEAAWFSYNDYNISPENNSYSDLTKNYDDPYKRWTVINSFNDEGPGGSGLQAYVIDTDDGNCIITFRGTHPVSDSDIAQDIFMADLGLLNSGETPQQKAAEKYVEYIYEQLGDRYKEFTFVGHSLGGNLAEHAAITAPAEMKSRCNAVSLDGPGFSDVYIKEHSAEIMAMNGRLERYTWSTIGAFLNPLPGEKYYRTEVGENYQQQISQILDFDHHNDKDHIHYDGNKFYVKEKGQEWKHNEIAWLVGEISRHLDDDLFLANLFNSLNPATALLAKMIKAKFSRIKRRVVYNPADPRNSVWAMPPETHYDSNTSFKTAGIINVDVKQLMEAHDKLKAFSSMIGRSADSSARTLKRVRMSPRFDRELQRKALEAEQDMEELKRRMELLADCLDQVADTYRRYETLSVQILSPSKWGGSAC